MKKNLTLQDHCKDTQSYLLSEWDYKKNLPYKPSSISKCSHKIIWWKCKLGHVWKAPVYRRVLDNTGCPYCSGRKVLQGFNDLATTNPELLNEWDFGKNDVSPYEIGPGSHKQVWWKCAKGHTWSTKIYNRTKGKSCPFCSNNKLLVGFNDLTTKFPSIAKQWNYQKNVNLSPENFLPGSSRKVWWVCERGHEWQTSINSRTSKHTSCPVCSGNKVLQGFNDLESTHPALCREWNFKKNGALRPRDVSAGSGKKVWWICDNGHEWKTSVSNRAKLKRNCPQCMKWTHTSLNEQILFYYVSNSFGDAVNGDRDVLDGKELDVYIPKLKLGIEYDDSWSHQSVNRDIEKNNICKEKGITLFRLRDKDCPPMHSSDGLKIFSCNLHNENEFVNCLGLLLSELGLQVEIDIENDRYKAYDNFISRRRDKSWVYENKVLCKEWDYDKNGNLRPQDLDKNSNLKVWWVCGQGHSWQAQLSKRNAGEGCPYCSGRKVLQGFNDLATTHSNLIKQWDYKKNSLRPSMVSRGSNKKIWWLCKHGHSWQASVSSRAIHGCGCPYCSGAKVIKGYNDLVTTNPEILKEWDYEKNKGISPESFSSGSHKQVYWICKEGHSWKAEIKSRIRAGSGCPYCSGLKILKGYNDLETTDPNLIKQWDYKKNSIRPSMVSRGSSKKIWWLCKHGHSWQARISNRAILKRDCPYCSGAKILRGFNDLATTHPELIKEWDFGKNDVSPYEVSKGSHKKVWWFNNKRGSWQAVIYSRTQE